MRFPVAGLVLSAVLALGALLPAVAADLERGKLLHDNHCRMCHDSIAYSRGVRIAQDYAQVKAQVTRWQTNTGLRWSAEDIDSVTAYVARTFYKLDIPSAQ
jgi:mono/diheme cytochrome c family protein